MRIHTNTPLRVQMLGQDCASLEQQVGVCERVAQQQRETSSWLDTMMKNLNDCLTSSSDPHVIKANLEKYNVSSTPSNGLLRQRFE